MKNLKSKRERERDLEVPCLFGREKRERKADPLLVGQGDR
jgi:hypothetical protein